MKCNMQAALAIGAGYLLGRMRPRTATVLAAAAATGKLGGLNGALVRRGTKTLGRTDIAAAVAPQLGDIADIVRGELLDAARTAAVAAVSGRIEALSGSLQDRADLLRNPASAAGGAGSTLGGLLKGNAARGDETAETRSAEDAEPAESDDTEEERPRSARRRSAPRKGARREDDEPRAEDEGDTEDDDPIDESDSEEEDDEPAEPAPVRRRASRSAGSRTRK